MVMRMSDLDWFVLKWVKKAYVGVKSLGNIKIIYVGFPEGVGAKTINELNEDAKYSKLKFSEVITENEIIWFVYKEV